MKFVQNRIWKHTKSLASKKILDWDDEGKWDRGPTCTSPSRVLPSKSSSFTLHHVAGFHRGKKEFPFFLSTIPAWSVKQVFRNLWQSFHSSFWGNSCDSTFDVTFASWSSLPGFIFLKFQSLIDTEVILHDLTAKVLCNRIHMQMKLKQLQEWN